MSIRKTLFWVFLILTWILPFPHESIMVSHSLVAFLKNFEPHHHIFFSESYADTKKNGHEEKANEAKVAKAPDSKEAGGFSLILTADEKAWLKTHPEITIGTMAAWPPMNFLDQSGRPNGIGADYIRALNHRLGGVLKIVSAPFDENLEKIKSRKLDCLMDVTPKPEREEFLNFTKTYLNIPHVIIAKKDSPYYSTEDDLSGKKLALEKGFGNVKYFREKYPDVRIVEYEDTSLALGAVVRGEADAYAGNRAVAAYIIEQELLGSFLVFQGQLRKPGSILAIGVRKDWPELAVILDKALASMTVEEIREIRLRWSGPVVQREDSSKKQITEEEREWLKANPLIRVSSEPDNAPFEFNEKGQPTGFSIDYINLVAERLDLKIEYVPGSSRESITAMIRQKDLDVMLDTVKTGDEQKSVLFSKPYARNPNLIISHKDKSYQRMEQLVGKTLAFPKGRGFEDVLSKYYPQIKMLPLSDTQDCVNAIFTAKADAILGEEAVIHSLISRNMLTGLYVSGEADIGNPDLSNLRLGIRSDWPLLHSAIMKVMEDISPNEISRLREKWLHNEALTATPKKALSVSYWEIIKLLVGFFIILFLISWTMIKTTKKDNITLQFGSPLFRGIVLGGLSLFVISVCLVGWVFLEDIKKRHLDDLDKKLKATLSLMDEKLDLWLSEKKSEMKHLGRDTSLAEITKSLLRLKQDKKDILNSNAIYQARSFFKSNDAIAGGVGFHIIAPDYLTICSSKEEDIGSKGAFFLKYPDYVKRAFNGEIDFISSMTSEIHEDDSSNADNALPSVFFVSPVHDSDNHILAVMVLEVTPWQNFIKDGNYLHDLETGEIYAFDKLGRMLSGSRFDEQLREIGLLAKGSVSALALEIRDPGVNLLEGEKAKQERKYQPMTHMAFKAIQLGEMMRQSGMTKGFSKIESDINGYRDYRGVPVFGAWLWNMEMDFGIAAEVDVAEAMSNFYQIRFMVVGILGFTMVLSIAAVLFVLFFGERASWALMSARDDLEVKVAERTAELKENQERFAALLESAPDAMVVLKDTGEILLVNSQAEKLFGYERNEMLGKPVELLVPESIRAIHPEKRMSYFNDPKVRRMAACGLELTAQVRDGALIPVDITLSLIETESGLFVVSSLRDITERKQAEEALRVSEEKLRLILESVGDGIFGVGLDGRIAFINSAASRLLGYEEDELIGQRVHEMTHHTHVDGTPFHLDDCPMYKSYKEGVSETVSDEMLWRKDGTGFFVEYTATPVRMNNELQGAVVVFRDITDRKRADETLRKSEERYSLVVRGSNDGIWDWDTVSDEVYFSPRYMAMLGYDPYGFPHEIEEWIKRIHTDDMDSVNAALRPCAGGITDSFEVEYRILHKDGEWRWILTKGANIKDASGRVIRLAGTHTDSTDRKCMEQALISERGRLQQILDMSPVGVVFSSKGVIYFANPMFVKMFDAGVGDPTPNLYVNLEERDLLLKRLDSNEKIENYELKLYGRDRQVRDMLINFISINYGGEDGILGWLMDITDRKRAEQEIKVKFEELSRFWKLAVGREKKMIELKKEINEILRKAGIEEKYKIH